MPLFAARRCAYGSAVLMIGVDVRNALSLQHPCENLR